MGVGDRLREWREAAGKTQKECADAVGVRQGTWCEYEKGRRVPRTSHAFAIETLTEGKITAREIAGAEVDIAEQRSATKGAA